MRYYSFLFAVCLSICLFGCDSDKRPQYKNRVFDFLIRYSPDWQMNEKVHPAVVAFTAPISYETDPFQENLSIVVQELPEPVSLEKYTQTITSHIKSISKMKDVSVNIVRSQPIKIAGVGGHQIVYTITQYGNPPELVKNDLAPKIDAEGETLQFMLSWVIRDERAYLLTYAAQKETYSTYLKDIESMIQSFRFM